jgi:hypothetical protein
VARQNSPFSTSVFSSLACQIALTPGNKIVSTAIASITSRARVVTFLASNPMRSVIVRSGNAM